MAGSDTRQRLIDAALAIVETEGAASITMRRVAADAGVTTMATYRHYANRQALIEAAAEAAFESLTRTWDRRGDRHDFDRRLFGLMDDFLDFVIDRPRLYTFLITERRFGVRQFPRDFEGGGSPAFAPVMDAVQQGMDQGVLRNDDPLEVTLAITSSAMGLSDLYLGGRIGLGADGFRALCRRSIERILRGLKA